MFGRTLRENKTDMYQSDKSAQKPRVRGAPNRQTETIEPRIIASLTFPHGYVHNFTRSQWTAPASSRGDADPEWATDPKSQATREADA